MSKGSKVGGSEVSDLIAALRSGSISLEELTGEFRRRSWARTRQPAPHSYMSLAAAAQSDPEPYVPGSIDEITGAYDRGEISPEEYRVLARAVAESIDAEYDGAEVVAEPGEDE
jgi:hypothetical protein